MDNQRTVALDAKVIRLREIVRELKSAAVCVSGGLDSSLLLAIAAEELGARAVAVTAIGPAYADTEVDDARRLAGQLGVRHELVDASELATAGYVENGPDRCWHCKNALYGAVTNHLSDWGVSNIVNGTNVDDLDDYRPGLKAAEEHHVRAPLLEAGLTKSDVRALAHLLGLNAWDKPASACLASRIPYGMKINASRLTQVAQVEAAVQSLGFRRVRVRHHDTVARIEVDEPDLERICADPVRKAVVNAGRNAGFLYVTVDLAGYRTGSHNEALPLKKLPIVR